MGRDYYPKKRLKIDPPLQLNEIMKLVGECPNRKKHRKNTYCEEWGLIEVTKNFCQVCVEQKTRHEDELRKEKAKVVTVQITNNIHSLIFTPV